MKCSLGISHFLEEISSLSHSIVFLYFFALITEEATNKFKGLDLSDRVPEELWTELRDIVQEAGIKTIPMEKKCKKAKWLSEETLMQSQVDLRKHHCKQS